MMQDSVPVLQRLSSPWSRKSVVLPPSRFPGQYPSGASRADWTWCAQPAHAVRTPDQLPDPRHAADLRAAVVERVHRGEVRRALRGSVHLPVRAVRAGGADPGADRACDAGAVADQCGRDRAQCGRRHAAARRLPRGRVVGDLRRAAGHDCRPADRGPTAVDRAAGGAAPRRARRLAAVGGNRRRFRRHRPGADAATGRCRSVGARRRDQADDCRDRRGGLGDARHALPEALRRSHRSADWNQPAVPRGARRGGAACLADGTDAVRADGEPVGRACGLGPGAVDRRDCAAAADDPARRSISGGGTALSGPAADRDRGIPAVRRKPHPDPDCRHGVRGRGVWLATR